MKKKYIFLFMIAVAILICGQALNNPGVSNAAGAPSGKTGSPGDGNVSCAEAGCHGGTAQSVAGLITSDIPSNKYIPGTVYTITCTASAAGINKFGFEVCSENAAHQKKGTWGIINAANTHIISTNYVTHTSSGTAGSGSKVWTAHWTAPVAGTGTVTFYGAFNLTNSDGTDNGDQIQVSNLAVTEGSVGIDETTENALNVSAFPNPVSDNLTLKYSLEKGCRVSVSLVSLTGQTLQTLPEQTLSTGTHETQLSGLSSLPEGVYFAMIKAGNSSSVKRILIQK